MRRELLQSIALVVAAAVVAALVLWLMRAKLLPPAQPSAADPTQTWPVYRNDEYGFTLRYPPQWTVAGPDLAANLVVGFESWDTPALVNRGRINTAYRYNFSIRAYDRLADHPSAKAQALAVPTVAEFFAQVRTVAPMGQTTLDGVTADEFIANSGHQYYGLLVPRADRFLTLNFERMWTKARFDATLTERAVLSSFRWLPLEGDDG